MAEQPEAETWQSPLVTRYAGEAMQRVFSPLHRARSWRRLWLALAESQRELGLEEVTAEAVEAMRQTVDEVDLERARAIERETRHDVVAHIRAWKEQAPAAGPVIHLGATSAYVGDNSDLVAIRDGLAIVRDRLLDAIEALASFAREHADLVCLAYTHLQPAQATTVGKRACLWLQDLLVDLEDVVRLREGLRFRGCKGTTGTQASYLELFDGDGERVDALDRMVAERMGFAGTFPVTGQTYPRKEDHRVLSALARVAGSAGKLAADVRLLQAFGEVLEPIESDQVGSSAMAYKRNPMRCERITALARFVSVGVQNAARTAGEQWMERTLDDSANRRLSIPEGFLATDGLLRVLVNVAGGLEVCEGRIRRRLEAELPSMATEPILMAAVRAGGDRQDLHERIRRHARAAVERVREGKPSNLVDRIAGDEAFAAIRDDIDRFLAPERFVGRAPEQTRRFLSEEVEPVLARLEERRTRRDASLDV